MDSYEQALIYMGNKLESVFCATCLSVNHVTAQIHKDKHLHAHLQYNESFIPHEKKSLLNTF